MDRWTEKAFDNIQANEESAVQPIREETLQWGLARLAELEKRFGITTPSLVAKALCISVPLTATLIHIKMWLFDESSGFDQILYWCGQ